jgi:hypothetical protein
VLRFDAATGRADGGFAVPLPTESIHAFGPDLMAGAGSTVARLDGETGRVLWRRTLGSSINASGAADGLIWTVYTSSVRGAPDRLIAIAADSGKTVTSTALRAFGAKALAVVGGDVWINTAGGQTLVLRR